MKSKKMITVMATTLFCLVFVGAMLAQGYERDDSDSTLAVEKTASLSSNQLHLNANYGIMGTQKTEPSLEELENAYYYQMIEDQYKKLNDDHLEITSPLEGQSTRDKLDPSCSC